MSKSCLVDLSHPISCKDMKRFAALYLFWGYWMAIAILVGVMLWRRKAEWFAAGLAVSGLVVSADAFRNVPLVVFFQLPRFSKR